MNERQRLSNLIRELDSEIAVHWRYIQRQPLTFAERSEARQELLRYAYLRRLAQGRAA